MQYAEENHSTVDVLNNAHRARNAICSIVEAKNDDVPIETNAGSLRSVAVVMGSLEQEVRRCGGDGCMGRSIDGVKLWVTMDRMATVRAIAESAIDRVKILEAALRAITVRGQTGFIDDYSMLNDWQAIAMEQQQIAESALNENK
jgi:hypothetical protein